MEPNQFHRDSLGSANTFKADTLPEGAVTCFGQGALRTLAISPDGQYLVIGSPRGLWWYDLATLSPMALWDTKQAVIAALSFSADGKWIATGDYEGSVKVWDIQDHTCVSHLKRWHGRKQLNYQHQISRIAFSPHSEKLAVSGKRDYIIDIWHPETGEHFLKLNSHFQREFRDCTLTRPLAFSPNSQLLAGSSPPGTNTDVTPERDFISVWDASNGLRVATLTECTTLVDSLCFSPSGNCLAATDVSGALKVWDVSNWKMSLEIQVEPHTWLLPSYSAEDVLRVAKISYNDRSIALCDIAPYQEHWACQTQADIRDVQFFAGTQLLVNSGLELKTWTIQGSQPESEHHAHIHCVESLEFSSDGDRVAAAYAYDEVLMWDIETSSYLENVFKPSGMKHRVFAAPNGKIHTTCVDGNTIKVWDVENQALVARLTLQEPPTYWAFAYAPISSLFATGDAEGTVKVWDVKQGIEHHTFTKHTTTILDLVFSPNGKFLVSRANYGPDARLWDVENRREVLGFPGDRIEDFGAFSPCSTRIAADTATEILVWDILSTSPQLTIPKPNEWWGNGWRQSAFAFSPDGRYLVSGADDDEGMRKIPIRLWALATGENIATFWGHTLSVFALAFSPDGTLLASGSYDGTILLWDMKPYLPYESSKCD